MIRILICSCTLISNIRNGMIRNKILNGEYCFVLSEDALTNTTKDLIAIISSLDRNKILNGEYYFVFCKDALTNDTTEDLIDSFRKNAVTNRAENLIDSLDIDTIKDIATIKDSRYSNTTLIHPFDFTKNNDNRYAVTNRAENLDDSRKNGQMEVIDDVPTDDIYDRTGTVARNLDSVQYDYAGNNITTTSTTYYCTEQIWIKNNNNYYNIRCNDGDDYHNIILI